MAQKLAEETLDKYEYKEKTIRQWADILSNVDYAKVVKCKDCKYAHYWYGNDTLGNTKYLCHYIEYDKFYPDVFADDFCSRGEKRNSETT